MAKAWNKIADKFFGPLVVAAIIACSGMVLGNSTTIARQDEQIKALTIDAAELKVDLKELISTVDGKVDRLGDKLDTITTHLMRQTQPQDR